MTLEKEFKQGIEVKNFMPRVNRVFNGMIEVDYHHLTIHCKAMVNKERTALWVRMPQDLSYENKVKVKFNCVGWADKQLSDWFQEEVLRQLKEKFPDAYIILPKDQIPKIKGVKKPFKKREFKGKVSRPTGVKEYRDLPPRRPTGSYQERKAQYKSNYMEKKY